MFIHVVFILGGVRLNPLGTSATIWSIVQLGYLEVTVHENLRIGWPGPFVKVEGYCD
jgi:hypothetical protein